MRRTVSHIKGVLKARLPWLVPLWRRLPYRLRRALAPRKLRVPPNPDPARMRERQARACGTYIGVTGSCGKTSATKLLGDVLSAYGTVRTGIGGNTEVSIFKNVWLAKDRHDFLVQETSGHHPDVLDPVLERLRIDVAVVTSVGEDHWFKHKHVARGEGSEASGEQYLAAIASEKGKLVAAVPPEGLACLNADDPHVAGMAKRARCRVVLFGTGANAEVRAEEIDAAWPGRLAFTLVVGDTRRRVTTRLVGTLLLPSVLAAIAVLHGLGLDTGRALPLLAESEPFEQRMSVHRGPSGRVFILDTRKAPGWSTELLIEDLAHLKADDLVFVLGEISDTRGDKGKTYRRILRMAASRVAHVIGFGPAASNARRVAEQGFANVHAADTYDEARALLAGLPPGPVLLKANKSTRLYKICEPCDPPVLRTKLGYDNKPRAPNRA